MEVEVNTIEGEKIFTTLYRLKVHFLFLKFLFSTLSVEG